VGSANFMRLSLKKTAHGALDGGAQQEIQGDFLVGITKALKGRRSNHHSSHHTEAVRGGGYFVCFLNAQATAFALGNCDTLLHKDCTATWYVVVRAVWQVCF
jgi:hypothetical protein